MSHQLANQIFETYVDPEVEALLEGLNKMPFDVHNRTIHEELRENFPYIPS